MHVSKTKLAVAVSLALGLAPIANADEMTIYGSVGAAMEALDNGSTSTTEVSNNHSAFGVKGSKTVNENLTAVYLFDAFVGIDAGGGAGDDSLFGGGRDGWVGVSGEEWGTVALGFQGRPWKTSTNHLDIFGSTAADYSAIMGTTGDNNLDGQSDVYFDGGIGSSLIYFGPNINGFSWHLQFGADENDDNTNDWGAQANYSREALYATLSYDVDGQGTSDDITATKLAVSYKIQENTNLVGMYDSISNGDNARDAFYVSVAHGVGNTTLKLAYAMADELDNVADSGASYYALGASHMLDANLEVFVLYSALTNDNGGAYNYTSSPHTSSNGNTAIAAAGDDSSVISAGIRYHFAWQNK